MIWERLIKWQNETIDVLNKHLVEYDEPGMERFNNEKLGWVNICLLYTSDAADD